MKNQSINLMKGIACIFVVFIHCQFPTKVGESIVVLGRFAVPFFALVTGYFSDFDDKEKSIYISQKRLKGIIKLTILSSGICVFLNLIVTCIQGGDWILPYLNLKTLIVFVFFNRASFLSSSMWYLFGLIYVYILWINALKWNKEKYLFFSVPFLLLANLIMTEILKLPWYVSGNFLFTLLPFFLIGNRIHRKQVKYTSKIFIGIIAANILVLMEHAFFGASFLYISSIIIAIFWLIVVKNDFIINTDIYRFCKGFCYLGEKLSMPIFVVHCGVMSIILAIIERCSIAISEWFLPFIVLFFSIVLSIIWNYIQIYGKRFGIKLKFCGK